MSSPEEMSERVTRIEESLKGLSLRLDSHVIDQRADLKLTREQAALINEKISLIHDEIKSYSTALRVFKLIAYTILAIATLNWSNIPGIWRGP